MDIFHITNKYLLNKKHILDKKWEEKVPYINKDIINKILFYYLIHIFFYNLHLILQNHLLPKSRIFRVSSSGHININKTVGLR